MPNSCVHFLKTIWSCFWFASILEKFKVYITVRFPGHIFIQYENGMCLNVASGHNNLSSNHKIRNRGFFRSLILTIYENVQKQASQSVPDDPSRMSSESQESEAVLFF